MEDFYATVAEDMSYLVREALATEGPSEEDLKALQLSFNE